MYGMWGVQRILYLGEYTTVVYMQVQVVVVVVRGCENSFTGYLRGMCRISNVSCISIVWRPCIFYGHIRALYTRLVNFMYNFFLPTCDESQTSVPAYCILCTYTYGICIRRSTIIIVTLRWWREKKKNVYMYICEKWFSARARPFEAAAPLLLQVSECFEITAAVWKVHTAACVRGYCYRGIVT